MQGELVSDTFTVTDEVEHTVPVCEGNGDNEFVDEIVGVADGRLDKDIVTEIDGDALVEDVSEGVYVEDTVDDTLNDPDAVEHRVGVIHALTETDFIIETLLIPLDVCELVKEVTPVGDTLFDRDRVPDPDKVEVAVTELDGDGETLSVLDTVVDGHGVAVTELLIVDEEETLTEVETDGVPVATLDEVAVVDTEEESDCTDV